MIQLPVCLILRIEKAIYSKIQYRIEGYMRKECFSFILCTVLISALAGCANSDKASEPERVEVVSAEEALNELM